MNRCSHIIFTILMNLVLVLSAFGQDAFRSGDGWGSGWGNNLYGNNYPTWGGTTWDLTNSGTSLKYFRFYTDNSAACNKEWGPGTDTQMTAGNILALVEGNSAAYYLNVQNTSYHYIFRTRSSTECASPEALYFEIQGDIRTISSLAQSPTSVFPGQDVVITATLSNTSNTGQGYYLRYTDDAFSTSTIIELTGSGTSYSATIPASSNFSNANLAYYVFSSGAGLIIAHADADFFTFSLDNNAGSNYSYTVAQYWETAASGNWETAATWTANVVPSAEQPIHIAAGHTVTTSSSSNIDFSSLNILAGGSLDLGTNSTFSLSEFNGITSDGNITAGLNSVLKAPLGGYMNGSGTIQLYNLQIGVDAGIGNYIYYLNSNLEISHDLIIEENGALYPGDGSNITLEMTGNPSSIYNDGLLDCIPDLADISNERLLLHISNGQTILRSNTSPLGAMRLGDITIDGGASLVSDAAGSLQVELQFGTLTCNGSINLGQLATGVAPITLRGIAGNNYFLNSANSGQIFQFKNLLIGNNAANDGGNLQLAAGSESVEMRVSGDFRNYFKFTAVNASSEHIDVVLNGATGNQEISGDLGETDANVFSFYNLEIDNAGGDVYFTSSSIDPNAVNNIDFEIQGDLVLSQGRGITLNTGPDIRHNLILYSGAGIIDTGAQSDEDGQPCYIEGPLVRRVAVGNGQSIQFPIGQGNDFRNLVFHTDVITSAVEITVEHFSYSANFANMNIISPIINISDVRFWNVKVDQNANLSNTQFEIEYGGADTDGVTSETDLRVVWAEQDASTDADPGNNDWNAIGSSGGTGQIITSGAFDFSAQGVDKIDITLGNIGLNVNPLPVTWLSFTCTQQYETNLLRWSTASEINSDYFVLERASEDFYFREINTSGAQGWSNEKTDYYFIDQTPINGHSYYRLKQVDLDGVFEYSDIISTHKGHKTGIYPNPFLDAVYLTANKLHAGGVFEIWTSLGSKVISGYLKDGPNKISTDQLLSGAYIIRITDNMGNQSAFKMIKYQ